MRTHHRSPAPGPRVDGRALRALWYDVGRLRDRLFIRAGFASPSTQKSLARLEPQWRSCQEQTDAALAPGADAKDRRAAVESLEALRRRYLALTERVSLELP